VPLPPPTERKIAAQNEDHIEAELNVENFPKNFEKKVKVPRKVIHCSDGVYEEYSTDEEEVEERRQEEQRVEKYKQINPKSLNWVPWMIYHTWFAGSSFIEYCDGWGEKLAW
jgi:hypothetical protein